MSLVVGPVQVGPTCSGGLFSGSESRLVRLDDSLSPVCLPALISAGTGVLPSINQPHFVLHKSTTTLHSHCTETELLPKIKPYDPLRYSIPLSIDDQIFKSDDRSRLFIRDDRDVPVILFSS